MRKKRKEKNLFFIIILLIIAAILGLIALNKITGYAISYSNNYDITCVYDKTLNDGPLKTSTDIFQKADLNLFNSKTQKYSNKKPTSDICEKKKVGKVYKDYVKEAYCNKKNTKTGRRDTISYKSSKEWTLCQDGCSNGACVKKCAPDCINKQCGGDGCGGSCGSCNGTDNCDNGLCKQNSITFKPSYIVNVPNSIGKYNKYCEYDKTRNKLAVIIKSGEIHDTPEFVHSFNDYANAVKQHLNISSSLVRFSGNNLSDFKSMIDSLVINNYTGYFILVGSDLPIYFNTTDSLVVPYFGYSDYMYLYLVNRTFGDGSDLCPDFAVSIIPDVNNGITDTNNLTNEKKAFMKQTFENFANYHSDNRSRLNNNTLIILWNNSLVNDGAPIIFEQEDAYRQKYPEPIQILYNTDKKLSSSYLEDHIIFGFHVHGTPTRIGLGITGTTYTTTDDILSLGNTNYKSPFVQVLMACQQNVIKYNIEPICYYKGSEKICNNPNEDCCWSQTWLRTGRWAFIQILGGGNDYAYTFNKQWKSKNILGDGVKATYSEPHLVFGDIASTLQH
jgi:hypothetical protein